MIRQITTLVLAFFMGFIIMAVELLCGKLMAPYFGASIHVWGSIIFTFMLALALGYLLGGRWSLHSPSLKRFGLLFVVAGSILLPAIWFAASLMDYIMLSIDDPRTGSLVSALLLFFLPTTFMGMAAPYAIRLLIVNKDKSGMTSGNLYFVSTLGSALGTLMSAFYLILWLPLNAIFFLCSGLLVTLGLLAILLDHFSSPVSLSHA